jgi:hypothetical protein
MAVTQDILRTWRGPRKVIRGLLADGPREDRALAYLIVACVLIFVAQWPRLSRAAAGFDVPAGAAVPELQQLMTYALFVWVMVVPLLLYGVAGLSHVLAKAVGGRGTFYAARLALFWSLLATIPLWLLQGLMAGFLGPDAPGTRLVGAVWLAGFGVIWALSLFEAEAG